MECKRAGELNSLCLVRCKWQVLRFRGEWISTEHQPAVWPLSLNSFSVLSTRNPVDHQLQKWIRSSKSHAGVQWGLWEQEGRSRSRDVEGLSALSHIPASSLWLRWWKALGKLLEWQTTLGNSVRHFQLSSKGRLKVGDTEGRLEQSKGKRNLESYVSCSSSAGLKPSHSYWQLVSLCHSLLHSCLIQISLTRSLFSTQLHIFSRGRNIINSWPPVICQMGLQLGKESKCMIGKQPIVWGIAWSHISL